MPESSFRSGFVTLLGKPNVGKSTLLNKLIGQQISITANKPQTTRNRIRGIVTEENCQAVILDTPGIHLPKNELHRRIVSYATQAIHETDLVFFLTEPSIKNPDTLSDRDKFVLDHLDSDQSNVILIINKIDICSQEQVLKSITVFNKAFSFKETVPVSALKGTGIDTLKSFFTKYLPEGIPFFPEDQMTDTPERVIVGEFVREQIIRHCFQEVPYGAAVQVEAFKESDKMVRIFATVYVEKDSHKKIIIGKKGSMLKKVGQNSRLKIEKLLGTRVYLDLHVKVARNWFNNPKKLVEFGYSKI